MTASIRKCRHVGYVLEGDNAGLPTVTVLPEIVCLADWPPANGDLYSGRQVNYGDLTGLPVIAVPITCCESPGDENDLVDDCVEGGLSRTLVGYVYDADNCFSARYLVFYLEYSEGFDEIDLEGCGQCPEGAGSWKGSIDLRGGSISVQVCCTVTESGTVFHVHLYGCLTPPLCYDIVEPFGCGNPITLSVPTFVLSDSHGDCCDCEGGQSAEIFIVIKGNCHRGALMGRHVGYDAGGLPLIAVNYCQPGEVYYPEGCIPTCDLVATVTAIDFEACFCTEGTYVLPYVGSLPGGGNSWSLPNPFPCLSSIVMTFTCSPGSSGAGGYAGPLNLTLAIMCDVDGSGGGTILYEEDDLENLDVTFEITMTEPPPPPYGCCNGRIDVRITR